MKTIRVTAEHIAAGRRFHRCECPIALAIKECTGEPWIVYHSRIDRIFGSLILALPDVARKFIADFDGGRPVQPIEFTLPLGNG